MSNPNCTDRPIPSAPRAQMRRRCAWSLLLLACAAAPSFAQAPPPRSGPPPASAAANGPVPPEWAKLTPQQRELLLAPVRDRWDSKPGERAQMLDRAQRWQKMAPEDRDRARHGMNRYQKLDPEQRSQFRALFRQMEGMPQDKREALRDRFEKMTPDQRREWIRQQPAPLQPGAPPR